jgi:hypothetical protein
MVAAAAVSATLLPRLAAPPAVPATAASVRHDLLGFVAVVAAVIAGYAFTDQAVAPLVRQAMAPLWQGSTLAPALQGRWADLVSLLLGIGITLPLAAWAARRARFETLLAGLHSYFSQPGVAFPVFIAYKLGDAFAADVGLPAQEHGLQPRRGRPGQQGHRPVADDRRRPARRRADAEARPVALPAAVRCAADGQQPGVLVAGGERQGPDAGPGDSGIRLGSSRWLRRRRWTAGC